MDLVLYIACCL